MEPVRNQVRSVVCVGLLLTSEVVSQVEGSVRWPIASRVGHQVWLHLRVLDVEGLLMGPKS